MSLTLCGNSVRKTLRKPRKRHTKRHTGEGGKRHTSEGQKGGTRHQDVKSRTWSGASVDRYESHPTRKRRAMSRVRSGSGGAT